VQDVQHPQSGALPDSAALHPGYGCERKALAISE